MPNIGVLGCGWIAQVHALTINRLDGVGFCRDVLGGKIYVYVSVDYAANAANCLIGQALGVSWAVSQTFVTV